MIAVLISAPLLQDGLCILITDEGRGEVGFPDLHGQGGQIYTFLPICMSSDGSDF
jgi:hypothetical protein